MTETIFVAGATGAIGRRLLPLLVHAGFSVYGTTRKPERQDEIRHAGAIPVLVDVFNVPVLTEAVRKVQPKIVIHQLTDLPYGLNPALMEEALKRTAHLRELGTQNLADAALTAGAEWLISQSLAFVYRQDTNPLTEETPLLESAAAIKTLERLTLETQGLSGTVLRYGLLYGQGTGSDGPQGKITLHVDDAADAALRAAQGQVRGVFNIVDDDGPVSNAKAKSGLGWFPKYGLRDA